MGLVCTPSTSGAFGRRCSTVAKYCASRRRAGILKRVRPRADAPRPRPAASSRQRRLLGLAATRPGTRGPSHALTVLHLGLRLGATVLHVLAHLGNAFATPAVSHDAALDRTLYHRLQTSGQRC